MKALYRFFKSVKLAVVLILFITGTSLLATLVPQGKDLPYYYHNYPPLLAWLITSTQFHHFFRSFILLFPGFLFFLNLGVCTVDRMVTRARSGAKLQLGPDLVHLGLLLLIVGGLLTFTGRLEGMTYLGEGDQVYLTEEYVLRLLRYQFFQYEDGRPKEWISTVTVEREGKPLITSFPIEVNKPLRVGSLKVFQSSFSKEVTAVLRDAQGKRSTLRAGQGFPFGDSVMVLRDIEAGSAGSAEQGTSDQPSTNPGSANQSPAGQRAVFEQWKDHRRLAVRRVQVTEEIGDYTLQALNTRDLTGLMVVKDPGYIPVIIALILITLGLTLTFVQKMGDRKL